MIAELLDIPFLAALVYQWIRADARHAAVVDARLEHGPAPARRTRASSQRPWWETDASVFGDGRGTSAVLTCVDRRPYPRLRR